MSEACIGCAVHQSLNSYSATVPLYFTTGKLKTIFKILEDRRMNELFRNQLEARFYVSLLLCNAHTCLFGSQTAQFFDFESPDLEDYLRPMFG